MKRYLVVHAALAWLLASGSALAEQPKLIGPPGQSNVSMTSYFEDPGNGEAAWDWDCASPACGCEVGCGCEIGCGCTYSGGGSCLGDCCLGDPCTLKDWLQPCCTTWNYGGWFQMGYHNKPTRMSFEYGDGGAFNDVPHQLNLHQAYYFVEKIADADHCSPDWGLRFDILYGTDAQKTQAFGNSLNAFGEPRGWDNSFDHGVYGWAIPQAYVELAYGDWSWKLGKFYTLVGYEVVTAPDNFFYSHSFTMFNSEPFTHTGVLGEYTVNDNLILHLGWVAGWDTGFDQFEGGSAIHAGFIVQLTEDLSYSYMMTAGDLGWRGDGYSHSNVLEVALSENLQYILQSDYVNTNYQVDFSGNNNEDIGINQYLLYSLNDCWGIGTRMEWWKSNQITGEAQSFYGLTAGVNYKPNANLVFRPEIRYNWTPAETTVQNTVGENFDQWVFGIDAIVTY